jgi:hypothetical protein
MPDLLLRKKAKGRGFSCNEVALAKLCQFLRAFPKAPARESLSLSKLYLGGEQDGS